jgi:hypothetical protein
MANTLKPITGHSEGEQITLKGIFRDCKWTLDFSVREVDAEGRPVKIEFIPDTGKRYALEERADDTGRDYLEPTRLFNTKVQNNLRNDAKERGYFMEDTFGEGAVKTTQYISYGQSAFILELGY